MLNYRPRKGSVVSKSSEEADKLLAKNPDALFPMIDSDNWRRAVPNLFLRSSIFGVGDRVLPDANEKIETLKNKKICSLRMYVILYSGEQLTQYDLSVWIAMMKIAQNDKFTFSDTLCFSARALAENMGLKYGSEVNNAIKVSLSALQSAKITVKHTKDDLVRTYSAGLIISIAGEEGLSKRTYQVKINKMLVNMFMWDDFTYLNTKVRHDLKSTLAKWVFGYYSSHAKPIPNSAETLLQMCGSKISNKNDFIKALKLAGDKIRDVCLANDFHFKMDVVKGMVFVERSGSVSQVRHNQKRNQISDTSVEISEYKAKLDLAKNPVTEEQIMNEKRRLNALRKIRVLKSRIRKNEDAINAERELVGKLAK